MSQSSNAMCPVPKCTKRGDFARGFCSKHYLEFRAACIQNGSWSKSDALAEPVRPKWEYEPTPEQVSALIEQHGVKNV